MPRAARRLPAGYCYHVLNRANARRTIFQKPADYRAFVRLIAESCQRIPLPVLAYCVMPNHFHFVLRPRGDLDVSQWMHRLTSTHVRRYHRHHGTSGRLWQGRFKAFAIQEDEHLLTVIRYVERNPLRAALVSRAENWRWSSLRWRDHVNRPSFLSEGPVPLPCDWPAIVNRTQTEPEIHAVRESVNRSAPFGADDWKRSAWKNAQQ